MNQKLIIEAQELIFEYKNHFRETLRSFGVHRIKHLTQSGKKNFFSHLKKTWMLKKKKNK